MVTCARICMSRWGAGQTWTSAGVHRRISVFEAGSAEVRGKNDKIGWFAV